jgi:hypothetical protein
MAVWQDQNDRHDTTNDNNFAFVDPNERVIAK